MHFGEELGGFLELARRQLLADDRGVDARVDQHLHVLLALVVRVRVLRAPVEVLPTKLVADSVVQRNALVVVVVLVQSYSEFERTLLPKSISGRITR